MNKNLEKYINMDYYHSSVWIIVRRNDDTIEIDVNQVKMLGMIHLTQTEYFITS